MTMPRLFKEAAYLQYFSDEKKAQALESEALTVSSMRTAGPGRKHRGSNQTESFIFYDRATPVQRSSGVATFY
jgi:hypothetical protein